MKRAMASTLEQMRAWGLGSSRVQQTFADQAPAERIRNGIIVMLIGLGLVWLTFGNSRLFAKRHRVATTYFGENGFAEWFTKAVTFAMRCAALIFVIAGALAIVGVLR